MSDQDFPELQSFKEQLKVRLERLDLGGGIRFDDKKALRKFFDDVQTRGMQRYKAKQATNRRS